MLWQVIKATDGYVAVGLNNDPTYTHQRNLVVEFDDDGNFKNSTPALFDPAGNLSGSGSRSFSVALDPNYNSINHIVIAGNGVSSSGTGDNGVISLLDLSGSSLSVTSTNYMGLSGGISKILTQAVAGSSNYNIFILGTINDGTPASYSSTNFNGTPKSLSVQNSDVFLAKLHKDFSTSHVPVTWNKSNLGGIVYTDMGRITARNFVSGTDIIKYIDPLSPGTFEESPITKGYSAPESNVCGSEDMIFTNDGKIAITASANYIHLTGGNLIDNANAVIGKADGTDGYDEYTDMDCYLIKVDPNDLSTFYNKNVGHFSGSDFRIKLIEDKSSRFIIAGSTADAYDGTDPNLPNNVDPYAENAYIVCTPDDGTSNDLWRRSFAAFPNEDCACIFGITLSADDGYVICGNNDNNGDDITVTKFAPLAEENYVQTGSYETFGGSSAPDVYTLTASEIWSSPKTIASEIVIPAGLTLTISNTTIQFASSDQLWDYFLFNNSAGDNTTYTVSDHSVVPFANGRMVGIIVKPGGHLVISSSTLQSINFPSTTDRNMWDGIVVQGSPINPAIYPYALQGTVTITGATTPSVIQDARFGLFAGDNWRSYVQPSAGYYTGVSGGLFYSGTNFSSRYDGNYHLGGGIITASNTSFLNCFYGADFQNYIWGRNGSKFTACTFNSDATGMGDVCFFADPNGNAIPANTHITGWQWSDLALYDNNFSCSNTFAPAMRPIGVHGVAMGLNITSYSLSTGNSFSNLSAGVQVSWPGCVNYPVSVVANTFDNNTYGVKASTTTTGNLIITDNEIKVPGYSIPYPAGIMLAGCSGYKVSRNTFDKCSTCGTTPGDFGIIINNGHSSNTTIDNNTFNSVYTATYAEQTNGDAHISGYIGAYYGLQFRCNVFDQSYRDIVRTSYIYPSPYPTEGTIRFKQGTCDGVTADAAGNQFNLSCVYAGGRLFDEDASVAHPVFYFNNNNGGIYDPGSCVSTLYIDNPCVSGVSDPTFGSACPASYVYSRQSHITALGDVATLDGVMSVTDDAGTLADLQGQHDDIVAYLAGYYALNAMYDSAAALLAGYNMYKDALPFYFTEGDYTDAQTMLNNITASTPGDALYKWTMQHSIDLYSAGQTWYDLDTTSQDSLSHILQYNQVSGYMAGAISAMQGKQPVIWPLPNMDSTSLDSALAYYSSLGGGGERTAAGQSAPSITNTSNKTSGLFSVFPNPAAGNITIQSSSAGKFVLFTLLGQQVQEYSVINGQTYVQLPNSLAAGIYLCKFTPDEGGITTQVRLVYQP